MSSEEEKPQFKISAAVVKQLGEELVSDELTAIMELVKNSYDADSDWVKITINTNDSYADTDLTFPETKGYIVIEDAGDGMSYNEITSKWLFISVSHKRQMKSKGELTPKLRTPLGDKGLGRLSSQRLGYVLEMFSSKEIEDIEHHVAFDWRHFTENAPLESVNTNYKTRKKTNIKGTKLVIADLKDPDIWTGEAGDKFRGQLSKLIFPFKEQRPFNIYLEINGVKNDLDEINDKLRQQAVSSYKIDFVGTKLCISGSLKLSKLQGNTNEKKETFNRLIQSDNGANFFEFLKSQIDNKQYFVPDATYAGAENVFFNFSREFDFVKDIKKEFVRDEEDKSKIIPANPGEFHGEIDEYNLSGTEEIESAYDSLSEYKLLVKNQVGVRIFRDGFGIKPYGMEDNDWLKLSKSQTSGGSFYLLRPENVIGFISITAKHNKHLVEKTDREGFIDTAFSKNFFSLISLAVKNINDVLDRTRRSYDEFKKKEAENKGGIQSFKDTKDRLINMSRQSLEIENEAKHVSTELQSTATKVTTEVNKIKNEPLFTSEQENKALHILEEVEKLLNGANNLFEKINSILSNAKKLEHDANYLEPKIQALELQIIQFSELAGLGITSEAFTHEVYNIIDRINGQTEQLLKKVKKEGKSDTALYLYTSNVKGFISSIRSQLNHLAPSLKFNRETKQPFVVSSFVEELKSYYENRFDGTIEIQHKIDKDFSISVNKGKLIQVVDNLILNSEYWLKEVSKSDKSFKASINIEVKSPSIFISDNGYGITPTLESTLFQPFVTSKPSNVGRGLGLFIVQQLLDSIDSNIILLNKRNDHNRRYIFQINLESLLS